MYGTSSPISRKFGTKELYIGVTPPMPDLSESLIANTRVLVIEAGSADCQLLLRTMRSGLFIQR